MNFILFLTADLVLSNLLNGSDRYLRVFQIDDRCNVPEKDFSNRLMVWGSSSTSFMREYDPEPSEENFCQKSGPFKSRKVQKCLHADPFKINGVEYSLTNADCKVNTSKNSNEACNKSDQFAFINVKNMGESLTIESDGYCIGGIGYPIVHSSKLIGSTSSYLQVQFAKKFFKKLKEVDYDEKLECLRIKKKVVIDFKKLATIFGKKGGNLDLNSVQDCFSLHEVPRSKFSSYSALATKSRNIKELESCSTKFLEPVQVKQLMSDLESFVVNFAKEGGLKFAAQVGKKVLQNSGIPGLSIVGSYLIDKIIES